MSGVADALRDFVAYTKTLDGYEKGEAQVWLERLFKAFGHAGYKEAGATLETKVRSAKRKGTCFADLVWPNRVLLEMKSRGEPLQKHLQQALDYWLHCVPGRPRYVVLCNFDELWIYDFDQQMDVPVDEVAVEDLPRRYAALNFLLPDNPPPQFANDKVGVTREAADKVAQVFQSLLGRGASREDAQRFVLQCVMAMFAEDFELLPNNIFTAQLQASKTPQDTYDRLHGLFRQMATRKPAEGGAFKQVKYFNGGLFSEVAPLELSRSDQTLLLEAASEDWSRVNPQIFGTLFQGSMDQGQRHVQGAHFTSAADIQQIVNPTIVRPWQEKISKAKTLGDYTDLLEELVKFRVLDPACGSGNFLYEAYLALVAIELEILERVREEFSEKSLNKISDFSWIGAPQFFGIDKDPFAVEIAKVTLLLAKQVAIEQARKRSAGVKGLLPYQKFATLPLDNLDANIVAADALFAPWPDADVIIGNPPFQAKNKMQGEFGAAYVSSVRERYPLVPGRADYCVYWLHRAHDELRPGCRAGLVGTNTIRQNFSREGGLDHIVKNGGEIFSAWSTKGWSGEASVHVSIVNWIKGTASGKRVLFRQFGDSANGEIQRLELDRISSALSGEFDITGARKLTCNARPKATFQGQTHGHEGFLVDRIKAQQIARATDGAPPLYPMLTLEEIIASHSVSASRFVIDFHPMDMPQAQGFPELFSIVKSKVLPDRQKAADEELQRNEEAKRQKSKARGNLHHQKFLKRWWHLSWPRADLLKRLSGLSRYVACGRVTKRPIFVLLPPSIRPNDSLQVFAFDDDYSFGVLQSGLHWLWFTERCSTLTERFRYTSTTVFDSFPWPQAPGESDVLSVCEAARELRAVRHQLRRTHRQGLRDQYRAIELPGEHPLKTRQDALDHAVRKAYGFTPKEDAISALFRLNQEVAELEVAGSEVTSPGLPPEFADLPTVRSADVEVEWAGWK